MRFLIILTIFIVSCTNSVTSLNDLDENIPDNDVEESELWTDSEDGSQVAIWLDGNYHDRGFSVATDKDGDIYVVGLMYFDVFFGKLFLSKFNSNRSLAWSRILENEGKVSNPSIAVNVEGMIFVTGYTDEDFDGKENAGYSDIFVAAFDENGNKLWTKLIGTDKPDVANSITVDKKGNIFICGKTFGSFEGYENFVSDCVVGEDHNCEDILVLKLSPEGEITNIDQWGTAENDSANDMAFDINGNLFVVGYTRGDLDGNTLGGGSCEGFPCADIFITKFSSTGEKLWTKQNGYEKEDFAQDIFIDNEDNLIICGSKLITMNSEGVEEWSKPFVDCSAVADSSDNIFTIGGEERDSLKVLMKVEPDGNTLWSKELNTLNKYGVFYGEMIADNMDNLIFTGSIENDYWNGGPKISQDDVFLKIWDKDEIK